MQVFKECIDLSDEINRINNLNQIKLQKIIIKKFKEKNLRYFKLDDKYHVLHKNNIYEILENNELYEIIFIDYLIEINNLNNNVKIETQKFKTEFLNKYKEKFEQLEILYEKCLKQLEIMNDNECLNLIKNLNLHYSYYRKSRNQIYADYVIFEDSNTYKGIGSKKEEIKPKEYLKLYSKYDYEISINFIKLLNNI